MSATENVEEYMDLVVVEAHQRGQQRLLVEGRLPALRRASERALMQRQDVGRPLRRGQGPPLRPDHVLHPL